MQAKVFVLVVKEGKKSAKDVAQSLGISDLQASELTKNLVDLGRLY
ncbi:hypothetical protein [Candidatus Nitrosotalea sp. TS]|nr:hypothetical protein [Candidatus Nitrosotalea sp. TS]